MAYQDMREWIQKLEEEGELSKIQVEVDWDLEIGGITQETFDNKGPALLFENVKDHQDTICTKLFTGSLGTYARMALMMGLPKDTPYPDLIRIWRERSRKPIKPVIAASGPCKENVLRGDDIDLFQFPVPQWHDRDGGRYIGTFDGVVTKKKDSDWMNVGLYRQMILDRNHTGITIPTGQHIWVHWRTHKNDAASLPVTVAIGWDPVLPAVACAPVPPLIHEYDIMGALRQEPVELVKCETCDLLVPASSEIILEGEVSTDFRTFREEGPFGEYAGYYCSVPAKRPVFKVNCITFRNNPIYQGTLEGVPINEDHIVSSVNHSAAIWDLLEERMIGVKGVNVDPSTAWSNVFVQIDNSYYGQVHQVATNIWSSGLSNMIGKNIIVVDEDIDVYDLGKIFWAIAYRVRPSQDIVTFPGWVSYLDPVVHPKDRIAAAVNKGERLLIDATKPFDNPRTDEWFGFKFPPLAYPDDATMEKVRRRWSEYGIKLHK
jgi:4-hydroxy-3-polyprenylbenzoate decarboxylase